MTVLSLKSPHSTRVPWRSRGEWTLGGDERCDAERPCIYCRDEVGGTRLARMISSAGSDERGRMTVEGRRQASLDSGDMCTLHLWWSGIAR